MVDSNATKNCIFSIYNSFFGLYSRLIKTEVSLKPVIEKMGSKTLNKKKDWTVSPAQTADYIAAHLKDMTHLARSAKMDRLVYFLEMAQIEATDLAQKIQIKK